VVDGIISQDEYRNGLGMRVQQIRDLLEIRNEQAKYLQIALDTETLAALQTSRDTAAAVIGRLIQPYRQGHCPLRFVYQGAIARGELVAGENWQVTPTDELLRVLRARLGLSAVRVYY